MKKRRKKEREQIYVSDGFTWGQRSFCVCVDCHLVTVNTNTVQFPPEWKQWDQF